MTTQMRLLHWLLRVLSDRLMLPLFELLGGTMDTTLGGRLCVLHAVGRMDAEEATYIPASEYPRVFFTARVTLAIYAGVIGLALTQRSLLPLMFIGLPTLYGSWLMPVFGLTQHAGMAEDVLDHRLNCRTVYMNPVFRYLYWNMNYHLEHHMFPLVPYHQLPRLHELVKDDCPPPYPSLTATYREIIPAVWRQMKDPGYYIRRKLPSSARPVGTVPTTPAIAAKGRRAVEILDGRTHHDRLDHQHLAADLRLELA